MLRHLSLLCWGAVHKLVGCFMLSHCFMQALTVSSRKDGRCRMTAWTGHTNADLFSLPTYHLEMCTLFLSPFLKHLCCPLVFCLLSPVELCDESSLNWVFQEWVPVWCFRIFAAWAEMIRKPLHLFQCGDWRYGGAELLVCLHVSVCGCPSWGSGIQSSFDLLSWPDRAGICRLCHKNQLNHVFFQHLAWLSFMETKWKLLEINWETLTSACTLECRDLPRDCSVLSGHHFLDPKRHLLLVEFCIDSCHSLHVPLSADISRSWLIYLRLSFTMNSWMAWSLLSSLPRSLLGL